MSPKPFRLLLVLGLVAQSTTGRAAEPPAMEQFLKFALAKEGDPARGADLFRSEQRLACSRCHTVDGSASHAGPDLFAVGDKFGRRELIDAVLRPSAQIAEGFSTTTIETKPGDEVTGILKQVTATEVALMGADAKLIRIPTDEIVRRRTSDISLMPEGLQNGLTLQEFTDLIDYLVSLKQVDHTAVAHRGMPDAIPTLATPVSFAPMHTAEAKFEHPACFSFMPGCSNVMLVGEHETGKLWRLEWGPNGEHKTLFLDTGVHDAGARGVIGVAFHPRFLENRRYFVEKQILAEGQFVSTIIERQASANYTVDSGCDARTILRVKGSSNSNHAGAMVFGPDNYFYIGMGDSGPGEDPEGHGQNTQTLLGKILRIDVDHSSAAEPYTSPQSNPFVGRAGCRPEIWAYGLREPWRFSFDRATGDLWAGDVGQDRYEEIDLVRPGENFGWNVYEGFEPFSNQYRRTNETYVAPVFSYRRQYGPCVTGGFVYRGDPKSSFYGVYIFGDYESRRLFGLTQKTRVLETVRQIGRAPERIAAFTEDTQGELYVLGYEGTVFRLNLNQSRFE